MMLETIKNYMDNLPEIPFVKFYQSYVEQVQDECIKLEFASLQRHNILNLNSMLQLLQQSAGEII